MPLKPGFQSTNCSGRQKENFLMGVSPIFRTLLPFTFPVRTCQAWRCQDQRNEERLSSCPRTCSSLAHNKPGQPETQELVTNPRGSCSYGTSKIRANIRHFRPIGKKNQKHPKEKLSVSRPQVEWERPAWQMEIHE